MNRMIFLSAGVFLLFLTFIMFSCAPVEVRDDDSIPDNLLPPKITGFSVSDSSRIEFIFSKQLVPSALVFEITPPLGTLSAQANGNSVIINLSEMQLPGFKYFIRGRVKDYIGNTLSFSADFYGFNPRVPDIIINEFTTNGSTTHPDMVELYIKSSGNMASVAFYAGCGCENDLQLIFPPFEINDGEYIVIHTKPQGIPAEIDETGPFETALDDSGGLDASPLARDFWIKGGSGLSGNNGALSVFSSPGADLIDALIYSNRTSLSDDTYRGFGSTVMLHKADCISDKGGWLFTGDIVTPEDCINPETSTATRSISRSSTSGDTNLISDWHVVPTSGYTFGLINNDAVYSPD